MGWLPVHSQNTGVLMVPVNPPSTMELAVSLFWRLVREVTWVKPPPEVKVARGRIVIRGGVKSEENLRDKLVENLGTLKRFGYDLELYVEPKTGRNGREFCCGDVGRIDLLCYDKKQRRFVVIELKNVKAGRYAFGQICSYVGWVHDNLLTSNKPIGLVISRGYDEQFGAALKVTDRIRHLNVRDSA